MLVFDQKLEDATDALQEFMNFCASKGQRAHVVGYHRTTRPLDVPLQLHMTGEDPGGGFATVIRPENCRAFNFIDSYHATISNLMIWPQGDQPPDCYLYFDRSYSHLLRDMRIHLGPGQQACTAAACIMDNVSGKNNNIIHENVVIRSDGPSYPVGYLLHPKCGTLNLQNPNIEKCGHAFVWRGGRVSVNQLYTERIGASILKADIDPIDTTPQFSAHGGVWAAAHSGFAFQLYRNIKNMTFHGVYFDTDLCQYEGYWYTPERGENVKFYGCRMNLSKWNEVPTCL
jgi:hypothetical protein